MALKLTELRMIFICTLLLCILVLTPEIVNTAYTIDDANDSGKAFLQSTVNAGTGLADKGDITQVITTIFKGVLAMTGFIFFILMIYGGYVWMSSQGNEEQVTKGRNTVIAAVIGIAIIVSGYAVTTFVTKALTK